MPDEEFLPEVSSFNRWHGVVGRAVRRASNARLESQIYTHDAISASWVALASADYRRRRAD